MNRQNNSAAGPKGDPPRRRQTQNRCVFCRVPDGGAEVATDDVTCQSSVIGLTAGCLTTKTPSSTGT